MDDESRGIPGSQIDASDVPEEGLPAAADAKGADSNTTPLEKPDDGEAEALLALQNLEKRRRDKKRKRIIKTVVVVAVIAAIAFAGINLLAPRENPDDASTAPAIAYVERTDFEDSVKGSGALKPKERVIVTPEVDGVVETVSVAKGQDVKKGDVLFTLRSNTVDKALSDAETQVKDAQADVDTAEGELDSQRDAADRKRQQYDDAKEQAEVDQEFAAQAYQDAYQAAMEEPEARLESAHKESEKKAQELANAKSKLKEAQENLSKAEKSGDQAAITEAKQAKFEAETKLALAESADEAAKAALVNEQENYEIAAADAMAAGQAAASTYSSQEVPEFDESTLDSSIRQAETAVNSAQRKLDAAEKGQKEATKDAEKCIVKAPKSGTLVAFDVVVGTKFGGQSESKATAQIADVSKLKVAIPVNETDIDAVKEGQRARCTFSALPDLQLEGKVVSTASTAAGSDSQTGDDGGNSVVNFEVEVLIDKPDPRLRLGMTADVEILTKDIKNALVIPVAALAESDQGTTVTVVTDEQTMETEQRSVVVGERSNSQAVIEKGLSEGEAVTVMMPGMPDAGTAEGGSSSETK